jgi:hypothetical protein
MTDDTEPKPEGDPEDEPQSQKPAAPAPRSAPRRRDDSEKAIGLEMARLFGMNPKVMMAPKSPPKSPSEAADDDEDGEPPD